MIKPIRLVGSATLLVTTMGVFGAQAFAATTPQAPSSSLTTVVAQGPGYVVTNGSPTAPKNFPKVQPMSTHNFTLAQGSSGSFDATTLYPYSDGNLGIWSFISVNDVNSFLNPSKLYASGQQYSYWTGTSPYDFSYVYAIPKEVASGQSVTCSVSVPPSFSVSNNCTTATITWPKATVKNNFQDMYTWTQWELQNQGCFTNVHTDDEATFQFGTADYGVLNDVNVNI